MPHITSAKALRFRNAGDLFKAMLEFCTDRVSGTRHGMSIAGRALRQLCHKVKPILKLLSVTNTVHDLISPCYHDQDLERTTSLYYRRRVRHRTSHRPETLRTWRQGCPGRHRRKGAGCRARGPRGKLPYDMRGHDRP